MERTMKNAYCIRDKTAFFRAVEGLCPGAGKEATIMFIGLFTQEFDQFVQLSQDDGANRVKLGEFVSNPTLEFMRETIHGLTLRIQCKDLCREMQRLFLCYWLFARSHSK